MLSFTGPLLHPVFYGVQIERKAALSQANGLRESVNFNEPVERGAAKCYFIAHGFWGQKLHREAPRGFRSHPLLTYFYFAQ